MEQEPRDKSAPAPLAAAVPGTEQPEPLIIPEHQLIRRIGRGSYGQIWLARTAMGLYRAVKIVFRKDFESDRPFQREWAGIRKFEPSSRLHEGFIDVLQVGINQPHGYFYYIMELGDDEKTAQNIDPETYRPHTLAGEILERGTLSLEQCLRLGIALSDALAELHKQGLVHRDIKPSNILFVNGVPKLADIGLVAGINEANSYVGTEGFIDPVCPGTAQADLYSLGKVLYEASTGHDRHDFPDLPASWSNSLDYQGLLELNEILLKACHRIPANRYASARDLNADLLVVLNGNSVKRLRLLEQRWANLKRISVLAAGVVLVAGAVGYHFYREWRMAQETRQHQVVLNIFHGNGAMESGDFLAALAPFSEALRLDQGRGQAELNDRLRFGSVLAQCPKVVRMTCMDKRANDAEFSPDGSKIVLAEKGGKVAIYDLQTGQLLPQSFGPGGDLNSAGYSPDGRYILAASMDKTAIVYDANSLEQICELEPSGGVFFGKFSPDGEHIVTSCMDGHARVWNWNGTSARLDFTVCVEPEPMAFATFSHDGKLLATVSRNGTVCICWVTNHQRIRPFWASSEGAPPLEFHHSTWVPFCSFSPDDQRLVTACYDHKAYVWDLATGRQISPALQHDAEVNSAEYSPDGLMIVTASYDGTVRLWDAADLQPLASNPILRHGERLTHASFSPDSRTIVITSNDGSVRVWDLAGSVLPPVPKPRFFCRNGTCYAIFTNNNFQLCDAATDKPLCSARHSLATIQQVALSPGGKHVVTVSSAPSERNCILQVWDSATNAASGHEILMSNSPAGLSLTDDGAKLAAYFENIAYVWETRTGSLLSKIDCTNTIDSALLSPSGDLLLTTSGGNALVWNPDGTPAYPPLRHPVPYCYAEFSRDGRYLVTSCWDQTLAKWFAQVWNAHSGKPISDRLWHGDGVRFATLSPDNAHVLTASEDYTARVWDTFTSKPISLPLRHQHQVLWADFNNNGSWIATASRDTTARIWDPEGDPLVPPFRQLTKAMTVQFTPDDRHLITTDTNGLALVWQLPIDHRPVAYLTQLAQLLSGQVTSPADPKTQPKPSDLWERLRAAHPEDFSVSTEQIVRWHQFKAEESEFRTNWFAAAFHLRQLLRLQPDDASLLDRLTRAETLRQGVQK